MKIYTRYILNYDHAMDTLVARKKESAVFAGFLDVSQTSSLAYM